MCGVTGIISDKPLNNNIIVSMTNELSHRGPDFQDIWSKNNKVFLGHSRLAILDLSNNGNQPMSSSSDRYVLTFNGEIYNHNHLRKKLDFYSWKSTSDTETILECFEQYGISETLKIIEGMFAFGVWDKKKDQLILARDRFGEKPMYYGLINNAFVFSSELKPVIKNFKSYLKIDQTSINYFIKRGYIPAPFSIFQNIKKLEPGTFLEVSQNKLSKYKINQYWKKNIDYSSSQENNNKEKNISFFKNKTLDLLDNSVKNQMISDAPLGAFLSSGVDSSIIVSLMQQNSLKKIQTFTVGFENKDYDESKIAKKISKHLNTDHNEIYFDKSDLISIVPNLKSIYDEPFADSSQIPTVLLCSLARKKVKVCLTGDGADELFGGYQRYKIIPIIIKLSSIYKIPLKILLFILKKRGVFFILRLFNLFIPSKVNFPIQEQKIDKLYELLMIESDKNVYNYFIDNFINTNEIVINNENIIKYDNFNINFSSTDLMNQDLYDYLPNDILCKTDRASMYNSLETRAPFLDYNLVNFTNTIPEKFKINGNINKIVLREIQKDFLPKNLINNKKIGFGIPLKMWLTNELSEWVNDTLNKQNIINQGILNYDIIIDRWKELKNDKKNWSVLIWHILILQAWLNEFFNK